MSSKTQLAEIEPARAQRRAPEITAGHWPCELKQSIDDAVFSADHALQLRGECIRGFAKGHKYQSGVSAHLPRNRPAHNKRYLSKTFLRGAFDMGRWWRVLQLPVVVLAATDAMVLLRFSHGVVSGKIVQP